MGLRLGLSRIYNTPVWRLDGQETVGESGISRWAWVNTFNSFTQKKKCFSLI